MATKSLYEIVLKDKETKDSPALSSYLFTEDEKIEFLSTNVIALNLLYSGKVDGGIPRGRISMISAPSMMGKSFIAYGLVKNAQKKGMQVCIIDTERAFSFQFAQAIGIDISPDKLIVLQENGIEEVSGIIMTICKEIPREERKNILFIIDSWGALVTSKTLDNALVGNDAADFTIPKKKNNLANIILNTKSTYFIVNHVYDNVGGMGDTLNIPGGRKVIFNSDCVVLGRSRAKDTKSASDKTVIGHIITAETYKSRFSKEKSKLKFRIKVDGGLDIFYGILEDALEAGAILTDKPGYYVRSHIENDKPISEKNLYCSDFWLPVFKDTDFKDYLEKKYTFNCPIDISKEHEALSIMQEEILETTSEELSEEKKSKKRKN
jgi:RecA/RadA recombinase